MTSRQDIVNQARTWLGTPFHHQGRLKKTTYNPGGCDCVGLIIGVSDELDIKHNGRKLSDYDQTDYARVPNGEQLKNAFSKNLKEISIDEMQAGDILMLRFNKDPQHVAIVSGTDGDFNIIHCYLSARKVVEHRLDEQWMGRVVAAFSLLVEKTKQIVD